MAEERYREREPEEPEEERHARVRRRRAAALAAVFAGTWLAQTAAMLFSRPRKEKDEHK